MRAREAARDGRQPRQVQRWIPYTRMSPHIKRAVLVAEDSGFWEHDGVDIEQIRASFEVNLERGEAVRGAEPPHLIGGMLPVEQPMGVLQGECRLADAPPG